MKDKREHPVAFYTHLVNVLTKNVEVKNYLTATVNSSAFGCRDQATWLVETKNTRKNIVLITVNATGVEIIVWESTKRSNFKGDCEAWCWETLPKLVIMKRWLKEKMKKYGHLKT